MKKKIFFLWLLLPAMCFGQVQIRLPDTTVLAGTTAKIPVYIDSNLSSYNVYSYQLQLSFTTGRLNPVGLDKTGTLTESWGDPLFNPSSGQVNLLAAGVSPLQGTGVLVYLVCETMNTYSTPFSFTGADQNFLNEGYPELIFDDGYIYKQNPPQITISPDNAELLAGESQQFEVSGDGTPPYDWGTTNPGISSIDGNGLLNTTTYGSTRVHCTDAAGLTDTSGTIQIRPLKLTLPDTSAWSGQIIDIPVFTSDVSGLGIVAGDIKFTFNDVYLTPLNISLDQTLLSGAEWVFLNTDEPGLIHVNFASSSSLAGEGILFYINFQVANLTSGSTNLDFSLATFNEDIIAKAENGHFSLNYANISFSPNSGEMIVGDQIDILVSGGTPPYIWEATNPEVVYLFNYGGGNNALINATAGGTTQIKVEDAYGIEKYSGNFTVFDTKVEIVSTAIPVGSTTLVPVTITDPPDGKEIYSLEMEFDCYENYLEFWGVDAEGTPTEDWQFVYDVSGDKMTVMAAGASPVSGPGIIFYLLMYARPIFPIGNQASIEILNCVFNEGSPTATLEGGQVTGSLALPNIQVAPQSVTMEVEQGSFVSTQIQVANTGLHNLIFSADISYDLGNEDALVLNVPDSPLPSEYNSNTLTENGWYEFEVQDTGIITNASISYSWLTDSWPQEGSMWIKNDETDNLQISSSELNGNYIHEIPGLTGSNLLNNWAIWIQDSYGDGGHKASNVELILYKTNEIQNYDWLSMSIPDSIVEPANNSTIAVSINSVGLEAGNYSAGISILSNDPDEPLITVQVEIEVVENAGIMDTVGLNDGWNLISLDIIPEDDSIQQVFSELIADEKLEYISGFQNQNGVYFDPNGPGFLNTLQKTSSGEGYWVQVNEDCELIASGNPIPDDFPVDLKEGWNLIGYWLDDPMPPEDAFADLISADILEYVSGYKNGGKYYDPNGPPFLNTLEYLENGFGYWVKVSVDVEGFFYENQK